MTWKKPGRSIALISKDSERTMATFLGAAVDLHQEDIDSDIFKGYKYFHLEGYLVQSEVTDPESSAGGQSPWPDHFH